MDDIKERGKQEIVKETFLDVRENGEFLSIDLRKEKQGKKELQLTWSGDRQLKQINNEEEEYVVMLFVHDPGFSCCFSRWWLQSVVAVGRTCAGRRRQEGINKPTKEATWASLFVNHNNYVKSRRPDRTESRDILRRTLTWNTWFRQENADMKLLHTKLTSLDLKFSSVLWDVALCNLVDRYQVSSRPAASVIKYLYIPEDSRSHT